jgi:outer membrane lipoprotein-sorting protein
MRGRRNLQESILIWMTLNLRLFGDGVRLGKVMGAAAVLGLALSAEAQGPAKVAETLHKLDLASAKFQSATADVRKDNYERVVRETTTQSGSVYFVKKGAATQMGAVFQPPAAKVFEFKDGKLRLFDPGTNHLQVFSTSDNQAKYESFLTLGFGGSGQDLAKAWTVDDQGTESIGDGKSAVKVERLVLLPKDPGTKGNITQVTLWLDVDRAVSLKQEFVFPSGDKQTAVYSNIKYNQKVDLKPFEIKCKGACS